MEFCSETNSLSVLIGDFLISKALHTSNVGNTRKVDASSMKSDTGSVSTKKIKLMTCVENISANMKLRKNEMIRKVPYFAMWNTLPTRLRLLANTRLEKYDIDVRLMHEVAKNIIVRYGIPIDHLDISDDVMNISVEQ